MRRFRPTNRWAAQFNSGELWKSQEETFHEYIGLRDIDDKTREGVSRHELFGGAARCQKLRRCTCGTCARRGPYGTCVYSVIYDENSSGRRGQLNNDDYRSSNPLLDILRPYAIKRRFIRRVSGPAIESAGRLSGRHPTNIICRLD